MRVLAIESSCDETAAAVVRDDGVVLGEVVRTQVEAHAPFGGIVPELAARDHLRAVTPVVQQTLEQAGVALAGLDAVAVTHRPGLVGALLVGLQAAKGLAWAAGLPLVGVDHLVGHLLAPLLAPATGRTLPRPDFPYVGLLVSGGHTGLYRCDGPLAEKMAELGGTRDDAVGEAFDKVAKLLGLGYPGGPVIERLAAQGEAGRARVKLPRPMAQRDSLEFSFSGLKSAVARHVASSDRPHDPGQVADLCSAFQAVVIEVLVRKTLHAARRSDVVRVVMGGGVAANSALRTAMRRACEQRQLSLYLPAPHHCTDNAAMIGLAGAIALAAGKRDQLSLGPSPRSVLPRVTRKGPGRRQVGVR